MAGLYDLDLDAQIVDDGAIGWDDPDNAAAASAANVTGDVAITGTSTLSATGVRTRLGSAAITGTSTLSASGEVTHLGAVAITGTSTLSATGTVTSNTPPAPPVQEQGGMVLGPLPRGRVTQTVTTVYIGGRGYTLRYLTIRVEHKYKLTTSRRQPIGKCSHASEDHVDSRHDETLPAAQRGVFAKHATTESMAWVAERNRIDELELMALL